MNKITGIQPSVYPLFMNQEKISSDPQHLAQLAKQQANVLGGTLNGQVQSSIRLQKQKEENKETMQHISSHVAAGYATILGLEAIHSVGSLSAHPQTTYQSKKNKKKHKTIPSFEETQADDEKDSFTED